MVDSIKKIVNIRFRQTIPFHLLNWLFSHTGLKKKLFPTN